MNTRTLFLVGFPLIWAASFLVLGAAAITSRPVLPGDELRNLSIAWDMWRGGSLLVPHLNGAPYAGELPLLYWVMNAGWSLFGLNEFWPRLISPLFGFASVFMSAALARILWPGWAGIGALSGTVLMGSMLWAVMSTIPDSTPIAVFCLLVAFWGVLFSWRTGQWGACVVAGLALGVGMLAVGPVLIVYILPAMMLAPLWGGRIMVGHEADDSEEDSSGGWRYWYLKMLVVVALAAVVMLAWMVPVILQQDPAYTEALLKNIFMPNLSLPGQDWWLYVLVITGLFLPWIVWPPAWRALAGVKYLIKDGGVWLCVFWILPVLGVFLLRPDAVLQALMFSMPAFALIMGFLIYIRADPEAARLDHKALSESVETEGDESQSSGRVSGYLATVFTRGESLVGLVVALLGAVVIVMPLAAGAFDLPWWVGRLSGSWGVIAMALGAMIAIAMPRTLGMRTLVLAVASVLVVSIGYMIAKPLRAEQSGLNDAAQRIRLLQGENIPVAFASQSQKPYLGEFAYMGKLEKPLDVLDQGDPVGAVAWVAGNPSAEVVTIHSMLPADLAPMAVFPWWGKYIAFWSVEAVQSRPDLIFSEKQP